MGREVGMWRERESVKARENVRLRLKREKGCRWRDIRDKVKAALCTVRFGSGTHEHKRGRRENGGCCERLASSLPD